MRRVSLFKLMGIWMSAGLLVYGCHILSVYVFLLKCRGGVRFFAVSMLAFLSFAYIGCRILYGRYRRIKSVCQLYIEGYISEKEFAEHISILKEMDIALQSGLEKLDKVKILDLSKKQAQYLALQNQINPHFLYNTLEGIRSEALCADVESVANMAETLAIFFRYTISNIDCVVTLEDELDNVMNYYAIQKYRFEDKLHIGVEYGEDSRVLAREMPKLILQPIVENAIYHGIENKMGKGNVRLRIEETNKRLVICVSDDGLGMEKDVLDELNQKLLTNTLDDIVDNERRRGGIAILNVNNRIKLLYGEEYGITVQSIKNIGTDVWIVLPSIGGDK